MGVWLVLCIFLLFLFLFLFCFLRHFTNSQNIIKTNFCAHFHHSHQWLSSQCHSLLASFEMASKKVGHFGIVTVCGLLLQISDLQISKHIKGSKQCYLLGQNTTCKFLVLSPLSTYKTTLTQQLNGKKTMKHETES